MTSTTYQVAVLTGSRRKRSYSRLIGNAFTKLAPESLELHRVEIEL